MDLAIWSNIPNPYNQYLYRSLRSLGVDLDVFYASEPQSRGRPWAIPRDPYETIAGTIRSEFRTLPDAARETTALISGGYLGKAETIRRLLIPRHVEHVWYLGGKTEVPKGARSVSPLVLQTLRRHLCHRLMGSPFL